MITKSKATKKAGRPQMIAGLLPDDSGIEFIGVDQGRKVIWIQHGCARRFEDLSEENYRICLDQFSEDLHAQEFFDSRHNFPEPLSLRRKVEIYIYYMYGQADAAADLDDGHLSFSENFRSAPDCPSLSFDLKIITIGGARLTRREIQMIDMMKEDFPDKAIAAELNNRDGSQGITESTLNFHKRRLFEKAQVQTKSALLQKAYSECI